MVRRPMPDEGRDESARQPAGPLDARSASRRRPGYRRRERVHFRRNKSLDGATAGDGGRGGSLSRLDKVMPLSTYCQRCGWAAD